MIEVFETEHRESKVQIVELPYRERHGPLRRGEVDLMVTRLPIDQSDLVVGPVVSREPRVLAVARDHPLARHESVSLEDVADHHVLGVADLGPKEIGAAFVPERTPAGRPIKRLQMTVHDFSEMVILIARGKIVQPTVASAMPRFAHPNVVCVPIVDMPPSSSALAWRRGASNPRVRAFLGVAREVLRNRRTSSPPAPARRAMRARQAMRHQIATEPTRH